MRVYPRPCGGTPSMVDSLAKNSGLSPPMRGNRGSHHLDHVGSGSIPAHAGEPSPVLHSPQLVSVYPRPCGGTSARSRVKRIGIRSIPAHAGEPYVVSHLMLPPCGGTAVQMRVVCPMPVYPRPCGGTGFFRDYTRSKEGLSPPMRGNRYLSPPSRHRSGSIPAHAGEPRTGQATAWSQGVYPRPCGGTSAPTSPKPTR